MTHLSAIAQLPARRRPARRRPAVVHVLTAAAGLGLGVTLGLAVTAESSRSLSAPGGVATALGRPAGLAAAYAMVIVVLLSFGTTTRDEARRAKAILDRHLLRPLGLVVTGLRKAERYGYASYASEEPETPAAVTVPARRRIGNRR